MDKDNQFFMLINGDEQMLSIFKRFSFFLFRLQNSVSDRTGNKSYKRDINTIPRPQKFYHAGTAPPVLKSAT